jgi:LRR receptor-like serine/threonine-protein kinase FLS2
MSYNKFYGKLPSTLFKCKQLQSLFLRENNFTGRVSPEIGNLTRLTNLDLAGNDFQGMLNLVLVNYMEFCV